ncbi:hypothetical protein [Gordonibacter sp.]|uniref:hypothetical protein n=1 Tax=Gordonibacter sp. TaxID=1968902 RepID=UPI002FC95945
MKKLLAILLSLLAVAVIGAVGIVALANTSGNPVSDAAKNVKAAATNAAMDAVDVKGQVKSAIDQHAGAIAAATGLTAEQVDEAIAQLDIDSWQAVALPDSAAKAGSIDASSFGIDGTIVTYKDPTYLTLEAYGQNVTLSVPESAQTYLPYLTLAQ